MLLFDPLVRGLRQDLEPPLLFELRVDVLLTRAELLLQVQLAIALEAAGVEPSVSDGVCDGAARLSLMSAIAKAAGFSERVDVGKRAPERLARVPQLQLPHARRVDEDAAARHENHLPVAAGMTSATVAGADLAGAKQLFADQGIRDRRLADPGRPEQYRRLASSKMLAEHGHRLGPLGGHDDDGNASSRCGDLLDEGVRSVDEVRLVQHDDWRGAAVPGSQQIALDSSRVEIEVEARDEKGDVDVGGEHLLLGGIAGRPARKTAGSRQHRADARVGVRLRRIDGHPVADGRKICALERVVAQAPRDAGEQLAVWRENAIDVRVFEADACRRETRGPVLGEGGVQARRPAEVVEAQHVGGRLPRIHRLRRHASLGHRDRRIAEHVVDQAVLLRLRRVEIEVGPLGVADDLPERLGRAIREDAVDLTLHLLQPIEMLRGRGRRLPSRPFRRLVNHDPRVWKGEPPARAGRLEYDRPHRVGHALHDDGDLDAARDEVAHGIVNRETVGHVAACAVDVQGDGPLAVVGQLPQALDDAARAVLVDVADEIYVAQPVGLLLAKRLLDRVHQIVEQPVADVAHIGRHYSIVHGFLRHCRQDLYC